jgi:transcriptional regulator with XRE-family HTH domain
LSLSAPAPSSSLALAAKFIRAARSLQEFTLVEVAHEAGLAPSTLSRVERGLIGLTPGTDQRIRDALTRLVQRRAAQLAQPKAS